MGYGTRSNGIKTFTPDNDEDTLYIDASCELGLVDLSLRIQEHFGYEGWPADFTIAAEHIHTDCLTYDLYDPGDYTDYLVIRKVK